MAEPAKASASQIAAMEALIEDTNRPVQNLNGRIIYKVELDSSSVASSMQVIALMWAFLAVYFMSQ